MEDKIKKAEDWYDKNANIYKQFSSEVAQIIDKILKSKCILYHSITNRVKEKESFINKCKKDSYSNPVEEIMDVAGVRIIAYTNNDVKKICKVIEQDFEIDGENSDNKIDNMDENIVGYLSVHYIAKLNDTRLKLTENIIYQNCICEIQVRTLLQHAWAEIEHDRNYKFSGILPKDIKRRFYLISGVLEMMDREFDALSKEIDDYSKMVQKKTKESDYDIEIDTESLSQYLLMKFKNNKNIIHLTAGVVNNDVIEELIRFGFIKIEDIEQALTEENLNKLIPKKGTRTYIGLLRDLMLFLDVKKYFQIYNNNWAGTTERQVRRWEEMGIKDIRNYLHDENIAIEYYDI